MNKVYSHALKQKQLPKKTLVTYNFTRSRFFFPCFLFFYTIFQPVLRMTNQSDGLQQIIDAHFTNNIKWDPEIVEIIFTKELLPFDFASHKLQQLEVAEYFEKVLHILYILYLS